MKFTTYESRFDNKGKTVEVSDIGTFLESNRSPAEKDISPLVGLYELKPDHKRSSSGVAQVYALGLDIDSGMSPAKAMEMLDGWEAYYFATHSYTKKHPKFRIIMPLEAPLYAYYYELVWSWVTENLIPENDKATRDPSRMFYLPREGVKIHYKKGDLLPLEHIILEQERVEELREGLRPTRQYSGECSLVDIQEALNDIDPDLEYMDWFRVASALKYTFGDVGKDLFTDWSSRGSKFAGEVGCSQFYDAQKPSGSVGVATIFHLAKGG
jgi:hypothetical protein